MHGNGKAMQTWVQHFEVSWQGYGIDANRWESKNTVWHTQAMRTYKILDTKTAFINQLQKSILVFQLNIICLNFNNYIIITNE